MELRVFNSRTKTKEMFVPKEPGKVSMYVCGVTPYNHPHIGNARPFLFWDVARRYLEFKGYVVSHIQNFTDIDDKIIATANKEGVTWDEIAGRYIQAYFEVMDKLNIRRADLYPKVSEHMPEIIEMVETLIRKGFAYVVEGDVYFSVEAFPTYGQLSGRSLEDMKAGARVEVDERKRHPMDFALWKSAKPEEPSWGSPWGSGRPGWHIECSAMSQRYLGSGFDFHGGGSDLVFPHHENEVAQSEAYSGTSPFVRYWLHNGFVTVNSEKMSKSLGNFFLVRDILEHFSPVVLRFFILSTHYRSPLDFSDERLNEADKSWKRIAATLTSTREVLNNKVLKEGGVATDLQHASSKAVDAFDEAMADDFNTALALSRLFDLCRVVNAHCQAAWRGEVPLDRSAAKTAVEVLEKMLNLLGLSTLEAEPVANQNEGQVAALMEVILELRQNARKNKEWATADRIRDKLQERGIVVEDSPQGARWRQT